MGMMTIEDYKDSMSQFFVFVRQCERLAMINRGDKLLIFEGMFECSTRS